MATKKYKRKRNKNHKIKNQYGCFSKKKSLALKGGNSFLSEFSNKVLPPVPPALNGPVWTVNSNGDSNHYAKNNLHSQIDYNPSQERNQINLSVNPWGKMWGKGGKKSRKNKRYSSQKGGDSFIDKIIPSDLLNVSRYTSWKVGELYNSYNGNHPSVSPLPWVQPALLKPINIPFIKHI